MSAYRSSIVSAIWVFPILAVLFTVPYVIHQYRKYGAILIFRVLIVYSFIFYLLCVYFLVILPLPDRETVAQMARPMLLDPLYEIKAFLNWSRLDRTSWRTILKTLDYWYLFQIVANVAMLVPLGIYLRYYFQKSWRQTLLLGFCLSLFLELTQLTGLYGIYPCAYRTFETADLINNTMGAMLGFWLSPLLEASLPSREQLDRLSYREGKAAVSFPHRLVAFCLDWMLLLVCGVGLLFLHRIGVIGGEWRRLEPELVYLAVTLLYFVLLPTVFHGATPGKWVVSIHVVKQEGERAGWWHLLLRYAILYWGILPLPYDIVRLYEWYLVTPYAWQKPVLVAIGGMMGLLFLIFTFTVMYGLVNRRFRFWHETFSHTCHARLERTSAGHRTERSEQPAAVEAERKE